MLSAVAAETLKLRRHRATWMLVWIFPIGVFIISALVIIAQLAQSDGQGGGTMSAAAWTENAADFWDGPRSAFVRFLISAYVALVFAGEYGWNTWKLIVPHRGRSSLLAAKYVVALGLLYVAFILAALIMMAMGWAEDALTGDPIPEGITFGALAHAHMQGFLASLPAVLFTASVAALAAILTRSTTAALVIGIVVVTLEQLFLTFGPALSLYVPGLVEFLYQALPFYHLVNLAEWVLDGKAQEAIFPPMTRIAYSWPVSLAIASAWTAGFVALTFWLFRRQDIN